MSGPARRSRHILLALSSLGSGGAERIASGMANWWAAHGTKVTVLTLMGMEDDHYALDPEVDRIALDFWGNARPRRLIVDKRVDRFLRLRTSIARAHPDVVISFMDITNVRTIAALLGTGIPVIVSERIDPRHQEIGAFWSLSRRLLYPLAKALVVQTRSVASWARRIVPGGKVFVVNNFIRDLPGQADPAGRQPMILAIGRLVPQKGHDLLMQAFAMTKEAHTGWRLTILGEGPERPRLEALAADLGIRDAVSLPGVVDEPAEWLYNSRLFVLASRFEGFPNALLEAMACGCPAIAADCPSGPAEIVRDGVNGVLVPAGDATALSRAMLRLMGDDGLCRRLAEQAPEVRTSFSQESIMTQWDAIVENILGRGA